MRIHPPKAFCAGDDTCPAECHYRALAQRPEYRAAWGLPPLPGQAPPPRRPKGGPGTELKAMLTELGIPTCGACSQRAEQMDEWGAAGCRQRKEEIVGWLHEQAQRASWSQFLRVAAKVLPLSLTDPLGALVDKAIERAEAKMTKKWAYGVTTVPARRATTLPRTLASLAAAGFDAPRLFVDGDDNARSWQAEFGLDVTMRGATIRTAANWHLGLLELYHRSPYADFYAMFQDDCLLVRNVRAYIERCQLPADCYLNLLNAHDNVLPADGRKGWYPSNQQGRGAVALVFGRLAASLVLSAPHLITRVQDANRGWRCIDGGVLEAFKQAGWKELIHWPSLAHHIDGPSSMGNKSYQPSASWPGEGADALTLAAASPS